MNVSNVIFAGIVATTVMTLIVESAYYLGIAKINLLRALGSLITRSENKSLVVGFAVHYSVGIFFALFYATLLTYAPTTSVATSIAIATFAGFLHGLVVGILFTILIAEHHPLLQFRSTGFGDVFVHIVAHASFGFSVGATLTLMSVSEFLPGTKVVFPFKDVLGYSISWLVIVGSPFAIIFALYLPWWFSKHQPAPAFERKSTDRNRIEEEKRAA